MSSEIIVALIAFAGTAIGAFGGIVSSAKLTNYRIRQLEKKVDAHNRFAERIPLIEQRVEGVSKRVSTLESRSNYYYLP